MGGVLAATAYTRQAGFGNSWLVCADGSGKPQRWSSGSEHFPALIFQQASTNQSLQSAHPGWADTFASAIQAPLLRESQDTKQAILQTLQAMAQLGTQTKELQAQTQLLQAQARLT